MNEPTPPPLAVHISCMERNREEWIPVRVVPFTAAAPANQPVHQTASETIMLPSDEPVQLSAAYAPVNRSVSVYVLGNDARGAETTLLFIGGFKPTDSGYDPTAIFLSPRGTHVQIMIGPVQPPV